MTLPSAPGAGQGTPQQPPTGRGPAPIDEVRWRSLAQDAGGEFVSRHRVLASELDMAIGVTFLECFSPRPRNALAVIDRHGEIVLIYRKVHTCAFDAEAALTPGDAFPTATLHTAAGPVTVGGMICFDREFPESARLLMLHGAEVILVPNACELESNRLGQIAARAFENMAAVAVANYPAPQCNGHSVAFDPMAFDSRGRSRSTLLVEAGEEEGIVLAEINLVALRAWRRNEVWGPAYRDPAVYADLVSGRET